MVLSTVNTSAWSVLVSSARNMNGSWSGTPNGRWSADTMVTPSVANATSSMSSPKMLPNNRHRARSAWPARP